MIATERITPNPSFRATLLIDGSKIVKVEVRQKKRLLFVANYMGTTRDAEAFRALARQHIRQHWNKPAKDHYQQMVDAVATRMQ